MSRVPDEDLFESTKMTFGEHLEELRVCLFRALIGLVIGVLLGLGVAKYVVEEIKGPVTKALQDFYIDKAINNLKADYGEISADVETVMRRDKIIFENIYVEKQELERIEQFRSTQGDETFDTEIGPPDTNLVKTRTWKPISAAVKSLNVHEVFMIWLKAATITGAVISSPWLFFQAWSFVAAGLYPHEKSYVYIFLPISLGLFLSGAALAFFFVFKPVLDFLFSFNQTMNIDPDPRISEWLSFVLFLPLGFGISFQLPLVMFVLQRIGIFTIEAYIEKWRVAVLIIFILAMFLTPADPVSMLLLAMPLTLLYFGGVAMCAWMPKRKSPFGEGYDPS